MKRPIRDTRELTWSYGGGTQSVAIAVLVTQGKLPKPDWIGIADTGRESSETWEYTDKWVRPMLRRVGLEIEIIPHSFSRLDLYGNNGDLLIPAYTAGGVPLPTFCSGTWKKETINKRLRQLGYGPKRPVITWIGISLDEIGRAKPSGRNWQEYDWPLLTVPAKRRSDCVEIIRSAGLPVAPKSSCWMCPFRKNAQWAHQRDNYPADHEKACRFDEQVRAKDKQGGVWIHFSSTPLREANLEMPDEPILPLFGEVTGCDSGMCWV